jgi:predicted DNA-binding transcriptional regulator YafY
MLKVLYQKIPDMPTPTSDNQDSYALIDRLMRLVNLLRYERLSIADMLARMPDHYPHSDTGRRKVRRDIHSLERLGYRFERQGRPAHFVLLSNTPILSDEDVQTLAALRDTFTDQHPLAARVHRLIATLTRNLSDEQQRIWQRRIALRMDLTPALNYESCAGLLFWLNDAIGNRRQIGFLYHAKGRQNPRWHPRLDPYEIEYTDRQFTLIAYSYEYHKVLSFRLNRIVQDPAQQSPQLLPNMQQPRRERRAIHFTYRLPASFADGGVSERFTIHSVVYEGEWVVVQASDTSEFRIIRVLLGYGEHALLLDGPPTLLEQMRQTVEKMGRLYGDGEK